MFRTHGFNYQKKDPLKVIVDNKENIARNQIDYIPIDRRYINGIKLVKTFPGSDIDSEHNPTTVGKLGIRMKKVKT